MEDINVLKIIISYLIPALLGGIIGRLSTKAKNDKEKQEKEEKKQKALEDGVVALLRNELIRRYREYESKGEITILDKENIEEMFKQYENLGGNGTVKELFDELKCLPTKIVES